MMSVRKIGFLLWSILGGWWMIAAPQSAPAIVLDKAASMELTGKVQTRLSIRTADSGGHTFPKVSSGNMVQHRNLAYMEFKHDVKRVAAPGDWGIKYRLLGRALYEGIYDYGPDVFQKVYDANSRAVGDMKFDMDLWEAYVDVSRGPLFIRTGKQNVSWGETDIFRLLDNINPLDNTYGGTFEDLDDRRIPLNMLRGTYNLGDLGPVSSITLEGFLVPGAVENSVSPLTPPGTPYAEPIPPTMGIPGVVDFTSRVFKPDEDMGDSRWGIRLQCIAGDNLNLSLAHYKTFLNFSDSPAVRSVVDRQFNPLAGQTAAVAVERHFEDVRITGASLSFYEPGTDMVVRSEVAYFEDVAVFIPDENMPAPTLAPTGLPAPFPPAIPRFNSGRIPTKDFIKFSLGFDKQLWIRPLNDKNSFTLSFQYFGSVAIDYDDRMRTGVPLPGSDPASRRYPTVKEYEQIMTFRASNYYRNGSLLPQFAAAYDPHGAWLLLPSLEYQRDPFRVKLQYSAISGAFNGFGVFRDRDQLSLNVTWMF